MYGNYFGQSLKTDGEKSTVGLTVCKKQINAGTSRPTSPPHDLGSKLMPSKKDEEAGCCRQKFVYR